jgi:hypothetical protein
MGTTQSPAFSKPPELLSLLNGIFIATCGKSVNTSIRKIKERSTKRLTKRVETMTQGKYIENLISHVLGPHTGEIIKRH